jgi:translation initiation factor IF-3
MNITDKQADFAREATEFLKNQGVRAESDLRNEKVGFKIREHTLARVPYLLVAGGREVDSRSLAVRTRSGKDLGVMPLEEVAARITRDAVCRGRDVLEDWSISTSKRTRRNDEILAPKLRIIGADGSQVGVVDRAEALQMAADAEMDLVEVSPTAEPPVCRIMDYGKFLFEQNKKAHSAKKKQKQIQIKEVKFRPGTDEADYQVKLRNLIRFLTDGDKAKVTLRFRGREMAHTELGRKLLDRLVVDLAELGVVEQRPLMEGRQMVMVIGPKKR